MLGPTPKVVADLHLYVGHSAVSPWILGKYRPTHNHLEIEIVSREILMTIPCEPSTVEGVLYATMKNLAVGLSPHETRNLAQTALIRRNTGWVAIHLASIAVRYLADMKTDGEIGILAHREEPTVMAAIRIILTDLLPRTRSARVARAVQYTIAALRAVQGLPS